MFSYAVLRVFIVALMGLIIKKIIENQIVNKTYSKWNSSVGSQKKHKCRTIYKIFITWCKYKIRKSPLNWAWRKLGKSRYQTNESWKRFYRMNNRFRGLPLLTRLQTLMFIDSFPWSHINKKNSIWVKGSLCDEIFYHCSHYNISLYVKQ